MGGGGGGGGGERDMQTPQPTKCWLTAKILKLFVASLVRFWPTYSFGSSKAKTPNCSVGCVAS